MRTIRLRMFLVLLSIGISLPAAAHTYLVLDAPFPNTQGTVARGINNEKTVVGTYVEFNGKQHGFRYKKGHFTSIDVPYSTHTQALGINDAGVIVGFYDDDRGTHGFRYDGLFATIDVPGGTATFATGINKRGHIIGYYRDGSRVKGFLYEKGRFTTIDVPNSLDTTLFGINNKGAIVGTFDDGVSHSFVFDDGVFTPFDVPFANVFDHGALGINNRGDIVGYYQTGTPQTISGLHGFVFAAGVYYSVDPPGGINPMVWDINNRGDFVGDFVTGNGTRFSGFIGLETDQRRRSRDETPDEED